MSVIELADEEVDAFTASATTGAEVEVFAGAYVPEQPERPRVGCVVPACNEEASIESVLQALLNQTRIPDVIHVIINNTTDDTFWVARELAGRHERNYRDEKMVCDIRVHDVGRLPERKVGALNIGFKLVEDCDYLLGVDGDTVLARDAVANLLAEISSDSRIGGISAIYSIDYAEGRNGGEKFLIAGQRQQFASFNLQNLLRGRNMAVLGGQCSIFSVAALKTVRDAHRQHGPWGSDSEVEDSLLSQQLKRCGFSTKISASARAEVGPMVTLKSLDAQQVKWNYGAIDLMWPGQWGDTSGQPFHPNLRLRWLENWSMLFNLLVRIGFVLLLAASMSIGALLALVTAATAGRDRAQRAHRPFDARPDGEGHRVRAALPARRAVHCGSNSATSSGPGRSSSVVATSTTRAPRPQRREERATTPSSSRSPISR